MITCENFEHVEKTRNRANISTENLLSHFEPPTKQQDKWERGIKHRYYELGFDMQNYYLFN